MQVQTQQVIRLPRVLEMVGMSKGSIYNFIKAGTFPKPVKIGPKASGWLLHEVQDWIASRIDARDSQ